MISGEMHYARIPRAYWTDRLQLARAMGLDAVSTYVFWNIHEPRPETYDFRAENDLAQFIYEAARAGLDVIVRPGPYVCAEWDFGGLPAWLLAADDFASQQSSQYPTRWVRTNDERFMRPVRRWLRRLGEELAPLQRSHGGPIVSIQLENEYGAFASASRGVSADRVGGEGHAAAKHGGHGQVKNETRDYLRVLREALVEAGFDESTFFTIDQAGDLAAGSLSDVPLAVTFGPGQYASAVEQLRSVKARTSAQAAAPLRCGEYWAGWFDHWGEPRPTDDEDQQVADLEQMLADGSTINIYMLHGGTNFGFTAGANAGATAEDSGGDHRLRRYRPITTSYDYHAAIDEAGRPRPKYFRFRDAIARYAGVALPPVPEAPATIDIAEFVLNESAALREALPEPIRSERPLPMEAYGQSFGYILYRTHIGALREATHSDGTRAAILSIERINDYAVVMLDSRVLTHLDRRLSQHEARFTSSAAISHLEILVENSGRINYGPELGTDRKGIDGCVLLEGKELRNWLVFPLPLDDISSLRFRETSSNAGETTESGAGYLAPTFYRGTFELDRPADTFLDVSSLGKGALWVNGHNAGRFWNIGPQRSLYVPGVWMHPGINEVIAFDLFGCEKIARLRGLHNPIYGPSIDRS